MKSIRICVILNVTLALVLLVLSTSVLHAETVTFSFSGTIRDNAGFFFLPERYRFSGHFTYDTSIDPNSLTTNRAVYIDALQQFAIDGTALSMPWADVRNSDPGSSDSFLLFATDDRGGQVRLSLNDFDGLALSDLSLPTSFDLPEFEIAQVTRSTGSGRVPNVGVIDTITRVSTPPSMETIAVFDNEPSLIAAAASSGTPIVARESFENVPTSEYGNPIEVAGIHYETRGTNGNLFGTFIKTWPAGDGIWGLGNNSSNDATISFGSGKHVNAFGLALKPLFPAEGEWRFLLTQVDGGVQTVTLPYDDTQPILYQGFFSNIGFKSIELVTVGTSNVSWDIVSHSVIVPEPTTGNMIILAGLIFLYPSASLKKCATALGKTRRAAGTGCTGEQNYQ